MSTLVLSLVLFFLRLDRLAVFTAHILLFSKLLLVLALEQLDYYYCLVANTTISYSSTWSILERIYSLLLLLLLLDGLGVQ